MMYFCRLLALPIPESHKIPTIFSDMAPKIPNEMLILLWALQVLNLNAN